ncbi:MAG: AraC family transcriptional regulator [Hungatella sp.]|nr:AraC family transcriptional regulator [Hungatella sp.]
MAKTVGYIDTQNFGLDELFFVDEVVMTKPFPVHRHSFAELQYFESGCGQEKINGITYAVMPGSFSLKMPWHAHELIPEKGKQMHIYKCSFRMQTLEEGGLLQSVGGELAQNYDFVPMEQLGEQDGLCVKELFSHMKEEASSVRMMQQEMAAAQIVQLLIIFIRNIQLQREKPDLTLSGKHVVQNVLRLINLRYREKELSCGQIARTVNCSEAQVGRLLREVTGLSFGELLREARIRNACVLLRNTDCSIEKIGEWAGYGSRAGFYKAFGEQMGMTPADYRRKYSSDRETKPARVLETSRVYTEIIYYLHRHYGEPLSQKELAKEFHYSTAYLERLLAENGTAFGELLRDIRIYHAKQQLLLSDSTIPAIAEQTGFASPETFHRVFKQQTGDTPGGYRKRMREDR